MIPARLGARPAVECWSVMPRQGPFVMEPTCRLCQSFAASELPTAAERGLPGNDTFTREPDICDACLDQDYAQRPRFGAVEALSVLVGSLAGLIAAGALVARGVAPVAASRPLSFVVLALEVHVVTVTAEDRRNLRCGSAVTDCESVEAHGLCGITAQHSTAGRALDRLSNHKDRSARPVRCSAGLSGRRTPRLTRRHKATGQGPRRPLRHCVA